MYQNTLPRSITANDSYTFLMKELEKVDDVILEPLSGTDWPRDMPVITGGGLTESIASIDVTYASTGQEDDNLYFDAANDIPVVQADMSKSVARALNFAEYMSFPFIGTLIQQRGRQMCSEPYEIKAPGRFARCFFFAKIAPESAV